MEKKKTQVRVEKGAGERKRSNSAALLNAARGGPVPVSKAAPRQSPTSQTPGLPVSAVPRPPPGASQELSEDPLYQLEMSEGVVAPPFSIFQLSRLPEEGSELKPCIEAMVTNIDSFGHRLEPRFEVNEKTTDKVKKVLEGEARAARNFFTNCGYDTTFQQIRRRSREDLEATGNAYWEMIYARTDAAKLMGINHVPSWTVRLCRMDKFYTEFLERRLIETGPQEYEWQEFKAWKRFRRFVQMKEGIKVYYKEHGDPRDLNRETGDYGTDAAPVPPDLRASEMLHFKIYCPRSPYGMPRWLGALFCIYGTRAADEINYVTFKNNNVPSMAILISNGQLTQESIDRITQYIEAQVGGDDNRSKFVVLEGEPATEGLKESPNVKIAIEPLVKVQHNDAMFSNYVMANNDRTRRMFRLPPLLVGKADEYTRATADAARKVADEQIFRPERDEFDSTMDRTLLSRLNIAHMRFMSNAPQTTDSTELVAILAQAERTGGLTPNIARLMIGTIFGRSLGHVESATLPGGTEFNPNVPFTLTLAEAVKNAGPVRSGTLPGEPPGDGKPAKADPALEKVLKQRLVTFIGVDVTNGHFDPPPLEKAA